MLSHHSLSVLPARALPFAVLVSVLLSAPPSGATTSAQAFNPTVARVALGYENPTAPPARFERCDTLVLSPNDDLGACDPTPLPGHFPVLSA